MKHSTPCIALSQYTRVLGAMAAEKSSSGCSRVKVRPSLKVDDVQELVKSHPQAVPQRYIRTKEERIGSTSITAPPCLEIPVIDMAKIASAAHTAARQHEMARLSLACEHWGFFQVSVQYLHMSLLYIIYLGLVRSKSLYG